MEKVQEQEQTVEVFENDMQLYLSMFCEEQGIEDIKKESQAVWNAALMYIRRHVFNDNSILKSSTPLNGYINNNYNNKYNNLNNSNCNSYDINIVSSICDYYIYMCMMYDKEVSINGFTFLTGISQDCIYAWGNNARELSTSGNEVYKKLNQYREESLSNKLATGNKNPVGVLAILNRHYQWNMPGVSREQATKRTLTDAELPKLSTTSGQIAGNDIQTIKEIAENPEKT